MRNVAALTAVSIAVLGFVALARSKGVRAQESPPAPEPEAQSAPVPAEPARTAVQRTRVVQPTALMVIDRKELELSGANNMSDALRYLSVNYGSDFNLDVATTAAGTSQMNLRGLGLHATLVLLNGKRLVQSGAVSVDGQNFVDLNALPLQAIERIEVLKGGASAIYGSDAVAGVVNIITRTQMDGVEAQIGAQTTDGFDQHEWDTSVFGGAQGENTRVTAMFSYFKREPLGATQRSFTHDNFVSSSFPSAFLAPDGSRVGGNAGCALQGAEQYDSRDVPGNPGLCAFNITPYFMLVPIEQRLNLFATVEHDLATHIKASFQGGYADTHTQRSLTPTLPLLNPVYVPANHPGNLSGQQLLWQGRLNPYRQSAGREVFDAHTWRTVAELTLDLSGLAAAVEERKWLGTLSGTWSETRFAHRSDDTNRSALQRALESCDPGDVNYSERDCIDPFSDQPVSSERLGRLGVETSSTTQNRLATLDANVTGGIATELLAGGALGIAAGVQFRRESTVARDLDDDAAFAAPPPQWAIPRSWKHARHVLSAYLELAFPIENGLEVQVDGRAEHYDDLRETVLLPNLGFTWIPAVTFAGPSAARFSQVSIRGTYARSIMPPALLQRYGAQSTPTPLYSVDDDRPRVSEPPNYALNYTVGNDRLKAGRSRAITAGVEWEPLSEVLVQADYWNYHLRGIVVRQTPQRHAIDVPADALTAAGAGQVIQQLRSEFETTRVTTHGLDLNLEWRTAFGSSTGDYLFRLNASHVFAYEIPAGQLTPGSACAGTDVAGCRNLKNFARSIPKWRATLLGSWTKDAHAFAIIGHVVPSYTDDGEPPWNGMQLPRSDEIGAFFALDLQYALRVEYRERMSTTIKLGVNNVFDADPPPANGPLGYDTEIHDPRGRLGYIRLIQQF